MSLNRDGLVCVWCKVPFVSHHGDGMYRLGVCKGCISNPRPLDYGRCCCSKDGTIVKLTKELDRASLENANIRDRLKIAESVSAELDRDTIKRSMSTRELQEELARRWQEEQDEWDD